MRPVVVKLTRASSKIIISVIQRMISSTLSAASNYQLQDCNGARRELVARGVARYTPSPMPPPLPPFPPALSRMSGLLSFSSFCIALRPYAR